MARLHTGAYDLISVVSDASRALMFFALLWLGLDV